ncbi:MAG: hypothetical protein Q8Q07_06120, partial [Dehalococcoidales bacterium]|nr:hypothetical protein [Dehalococcoidales bacterium]
KEVAVIPAKAGIQGIDMDSGSSLSWRQARVRNDRTVKTFVIHYTSVMQRRNDQTDFLAPCGRG